MRGERGKGRFGKVPLDMIIMKLYPLQNNSFCFFNVYLFNAFSDRYDSGDGFSSYFVKRGLTTKRSRQETLPGEGNCVIIFTIERTTKEIIIKRVMSVFRV